MLIWMCLERDWTLITRDSAPGDYRELGLKTLWRGVLQFPQQRRSPPAAHCFHRPCDREHCAAEHAGEACE
jgi:hypothetical protein